jgi:hypothetical protein
MIASGVARRIPSSFKDQCDLERHIATAQPMNAAKLMIGQDVGNLQPGTR